MFELLFKYPQAAYSKGNLVLLGTWPVWVLGLLIVLAAVVLAIPIWRQRRQRRIRLPWRRQWTVWTLQSLLATLILFLLWHPALSIATLQPQQNVIAVIIDDSDSMSEKEDSKSRLQGAVDTLNGGVLENLRKRFQVRIYRLGKGVERIENLKQLRGSAPVSEISEGLRQVAEESASVPIGAMVLLSDGADNAGGVDLETIREIRRHRIPVHTIGFGREELQNDVELTDAVLPARALPDSRLSAVVTLRQQGFSGRKAKVVVRDGGKTIASAEVELKNDGQQQTVPVFFNSGAAGAKNLQIAVGPFEGESNRNNNVVTRLVNVEATKPRILYTEGEPRWEFKFIRRAEDRDSSLQLASILRTTQNKIYRQGINSPSELEDGFPSKAEELFAYQGLIIGDVEAGYFTPAQLDLIRDFADRRGGGVLFLGGHSTLSDGGYLHTPLAEMLPVMLPDRKETYRREPAAVQLTVAGGDSPVSRLEENPQQNIDRWKKLPVLADYQDVGTPKPGALVLAEFIPAGHRPLPLLATENFGRGRTAVFATGGSWRWRMFQEHTDTSHEMFWRQLLRWLVAGSPGQVTATTPRPVLSDETRVPIRVEVRDKSFQPAPDARVEAHILGPGGLAETLQVPPAKDEPGVYAAPWDAEAAGSYLAEVVASRSGQEIGRDVLVFRREDGVAESFRREQNRGLLAGLSEQTGGRYYKPENASRLVDEISYSEAGINVRETKDLWNLPVFFALLLVIPASEWLLRRRWGLI